jgi:hypothetical protein
MPRRITFHRYDGEPLPIGARLVTRASRWGNPFQITPWEPTRGYIVQWARRMAPPPWAVPCYFTDRDAAHNCAVLLYRRWIGGPDQAALLAAMRAALRGRDIACSCPPELACHADVILEIVNASEPAALVQGELFGPPTD